MTGRTVVAAATSIGTGDSSIPNRLLRGERADLVILADAVLLKLIREGLVIADSYTPLVVSEIGLAVRAGARKPAVGTESSLRETLLRAQSIVYSYSVSGAYVSTRLFQRLRIADQMRIKSWCISDGERVGAVIARGEAEVGFQQVSELLPIRGIDHITPLPSAFQERNLFSAGVGARTRDLQAARAVIRFLISPDAADAIRQSGLEPLETMQPAGALGG